MWFSEDLPQKFESVSPPFYEVFRTNGEHEFESEKYVSKIFGSNLDPEKFSEYPAFWSMFRLEQNIECAGLFHYRCILDLSGKYTEDTWKSMNHGRDELVIQSQFLESYTFVMAVSIPLNFVTDGLSN